MKITTRSAIYPLGTLIILASTLSIAQAAPITVNFTANIGGSGSLSTAGPGVAGSITYDSIGTDGNPGDPTKSIYLFSGAPYGFSVLIDNFGTLSAATSLVQVGDNGAFLPGSDTFQLAGNDGAYQLRIDWAGSISTFAGDGIQTPAVLSGMNPTLVITNSGQTEVLASLNSLSFSVVPVPAALWLFTSALGLLAGVRGRLIAGSRLEKA